MRCNECEDKKNFTQPVIEITNPEQLILFRKVVIPVSMGTEEQVPPTIGKYRNVLLHYDANSHNYLYSSDGIPTLLEAAIPQEILDKLDSLEAAIVTEEAERIAGDEILDGAITSETEARESADAALSSRIDSLSSSLSAETTAREQADQTLQTNISNEAQARANGDASLNTAIVNEATARQNADANLQQQIDGITASSDVKDIVGTKAELNSYDTSTLGDNDIIKVLQDESENDATTYYRWNATTQQFALIGEEGPYYTKSQADTLLNAKQNTLTAGSNVQIVGDTISATDTTYTAGTGLALNGTQFSADTTVLATQTDLAGKQDTLTAGTGIDITNNVISTTSTGPTVVQTLGTSTTDVMSQNATTSMVYADPSTTENIKIGKYTSSTSHSVVIGTNARSNGANSVAIGGNGNNNSDYITKAASENSVAIGVGAQVGSNAKNSVAIGSGAKTTQKGQFDIGVFDGWGGGYNDSAYRLLTGLYDGQNDHDAVTVGQMNAAIATIDEPIEFSAAEWNSLWV